MKTRINDVLRTFLRARYYENNILFEDLCLRWVCRYHLFIFKDDYAIIQKFQKPTTRQAFVNLCTRMIREMDYVERAALMDSRDIYDRTRMLLHRLRAYAIHYPVLWWITFRLVPPQSPRL